MLSLPPAALSLARRQDDVLTRRDLLGFGLTDSLLRRRLRAGVWTSCMRGAVLVPPVRDPFRSHARAALLTCGGGVLGHETAARLHGLEGFPRWIREEPPHVVLPPPRTRAQRPGVRQHWQSLTRDEVVHRPGFPATSVARTLADLARRVDRRTALFLLDSALHNNLLQPSETPWGLPLDLVRLADGRAESPAESLARLICAEAGIPAEALQWVVHDRAVFVARLDLAWPSRMVALEVDSRYHDEPSALYQDRDRQNRLLLLGWTVVRVTWHDLTTNPIGVLARLFQALGRSGKLTISR